METTADFAVALLTQYSFDLSGYTARELVNRWLDDYPANWIYQGIVEALYQGRYKAISVEQILFAWHRRGHVAYHFNHEFERLICSQFPQKLTEQTQTETSISPSVPETAHHQLEPKTIANFTPSVGRARRELAQKKIDRMIEDDQRSRSTLGDRSRPIEQFAPTTDSSDFYTKLRTMTQHLGG